MAGGDDRPVTREEFEELQLRVLELASTANSMAELFRIHVEEMRGYMHTLVKVVSGQTPDKCVPLETHRAIIKGVLVAFSVITAVAVGLGKYAPILFK